MRPRLKLLFFLKQNISYMYQNMNMSTKQKTTVSLSLSTVFLISTVPCPFISFLILVVINSSASGVHCK